MRWIGRARVTENVCVTREKELWRTLLGIYPRVDPIRCIASIWYPNICLSLSTRRALRFATRERNIAFKQHLPSVSRHQYAADEAMCTWIFESKQQFALCCKQKLATSHVAFHVTLMWGRIRHQTRCIRYNVM